MTRGLGQDLVFLHGYGANKECFLQQINYFSTFYKVTAFDFPGFGQSEGIPSPWSVGDYAKFTAEFLGERGIKTPIFIAHSFGARVAVHLTANGYPVKKQVLVGAAGIILNRGAVYKAKIAAYRLIKRLAPRFAEKKFGSKEYRALSPVMRESYKKIVNEDLRGSAKKITAPTLLVYGEKDKTTPQKAGRIYLSAIENSRLIVLKNTGHFPFLDDPVSFDRTVEEFLE